MRTIATPLPARRRRAARSSCRRPPERWLRASRCVSRWWCSAPAAPGAASSPLGSERPLLMATLATAQPTGEERTHQVPSRSPWSPGGFKPAKASAPLRRRRRDCHRPAAQPAGDHRQRQSYWRRRPRSKAGGGGECRTRSRSCLDHADQGVPTRRLASRPPISVQHRRQSRCRGCRPWPTPRAVRSRLVHQPIRHPAQQLAANVGIHKRVGGGLGRSARGSKSRGAPFPHVGWVPCCGLQALTRAGEPRAKLSRVTVTARRSPGIGAVRPSRQGRGPSRASSPTNHRRPTPSSARIRFTDQPCSTCRACR
jgi:hypothetical protein